MHINKEVLLKAKEMMLEEPKRVRMSCFGLRIPQDDVVDGLFHSRSLANYGDSIDIEVPDCHTVGCAAFWICAASDGIDHAVAMVGTKIATRAKDLVGTYSLASMFYPKSWVDFTGNHVDAARYTKADQPGKAQVVGEIIDKFILWAEAQPGS